MKVACICPTYARCGTRTILLEEAIESFLKQDYQGERELLIVNDAVEQVLHCDAPNVRVVNTAWRFGSLGEKYNYMVRNAAADIYLPWEDDDISLPGRISQAVSALAGIESGYFNPQRSWFLDGHNPLSWNHKHGVCHNASAFTRRAFDTVGGYGWISGPQDADIDSRMKQSPGVFVTPQLGPRPNEWQYIYRWSVGNHLSGHKNPELAYKHWPKPLPGVFELRPQWVRNYATWASDVASRVGNTTPWGV